MLSIHLMQRHYGHQRQPAAYSHSLLLIFIFVLSFIQPKKHPCHILFPNSAHVSSQAHTLVARGNSTQNRKIKTKKKIRPDQGPPRCSVLERCG